MQIIFTRLIILTKLIWFAETDAVVVDCDTHVNQREDLITQPDNVIRAKFGIPQEKYVP